MGKLMSQKEAVRAQILDMLEEGRIDQKEAGKRLEISVRQVKRLVKLYRAEGLPGLINKQRGKPSNRCLDKAAVPAHAVLSPVQKCRFHTLAVFTSTFVG